MSMLMSIGGIIVVIALAMTVLKSKSGKQNPYCCFADSAGDFYNIEYIVVIIYTGLLPPNFYFFDYII